MEPLLEMMQVKDNSEVVPQFWHVDEFADFENATTIQDYNGRVFIKKNFVRYGLDRGLKYRADLRVNPFKYGFVGGTDNHNGSPGSVAEDNYIGTEAPQILVWAVKDSGGLNLDRIQIIKGWLEGGEMMDKVFDVVASGDRMRADGSVEPIDAPIDLKTGQFNTGKGSAQLMGCGPILISIRRRKPTNIFTCCNSRPLAVEFTFGYQGTAYINEYHGNPDFTGTTA